MPAKIGGVMPFLKIEQTAFGEIKRTSSSRRSGSVFNRFHILSNSAPVRGDTMLTNVFFEEENEVVKIVVAPRLAVLQI